MISVIVAMFIHLLLLLGSDGFLPGTAVINFRSGEPSRVDERGQWSRIYENKKDKEPESDTESPTSSSSASEGFTINDEPAVVPPGTEPIRTIGGGADMIFEMARQMLLWDETEEYLSAPADTKAAANGDGNNNDPPPPASELLKKYQQGTSTSASGTSDTNARGTVRRRRAHVLPRWRPLEGVSDVNPKFRTQAPMMNGLGYSRTIWRNVRKANKPSLWRHAIRTYDRMDQNTATKAINDNSGQASKVDSPTKLKVQRTNAHHEGALVACAKLGLWKKAMQIYQDVEEQQEKQASGRNTCFVTDNMVLSVIRSCVRGSRDLDNIEKSLEERREPLDACSEILLSMEQEHGLPLVARHLNPLAAAYQKLGLQPEASTLLNMNLEDRTSGPEEENGIDTFNVNDVRAKGNLKQLVSLLSS
jgi:hypothetical protein